MSAPPPIGQCHRDQTPTRTRLLCMYVRVCACVCVRACACVCVWHGVSGLHDTHLEAVREALVASGWSRRVWVEGHAQRRWRDHSERRTMHAPKREGMCAVQPGAGAARQEPRR
eukprot:COSAG01_NODE_5380_length_4295_cov_312.910867_2_plen_114_part_00